MYKNNVRLLGRTEIHINIFPNLDKSFKQHGPLFDTIYVVVNSPINAIRDCLLYAGSQSGRFKV